MMQHFAHFVARFKSWLSFWIAPKFCIAKSFERTDCYYKCSSIEIKHQSRLELNHGLVDQFARFQESAF